MPESRGIGLMGVAKVDADHVANMMIRRSHAGFLVYLKSALGHWSLKKQTTVESSRAVSVLSLSP